MNDKTNTAHVIVLGNEKGGTGKSTTAMHITVMLLKKGFNVAVLDLDSRQQSLNRYVQNRNTFVERHGLKLEIPASYVIQPSKSKDISKSQQEEAEQFGKLLDQIRKENDFVVVDCPGNDTLLARLAHSMANTLITPMNDSFVDLDLLGHVDPDTYKVTKLSCYSEIVWDCRKNRAAAGKPAMDWVVLRNRMATIHAKNKKRVDDAIIQLQSRVSFRYISGLSERVVFKELFPQGLTLMDILETQDKPKATMSQIAARHEMRKMVNELNLPGV